MPQWAQFFENHGVKVVSRTDKKRRAYVPTAAQRFALAAAGVEPSSGVIKAVHTVGVLFDPSLRSMQVSYYNAERVDSGRRPEARIGQGFSRWISEGDQVVIGNIGKRVFVAKGPVPPLGEQFLTTEDGDLVVTEKGEPLTVSVDPDLDQLLQNLQRGDPVLLGSPVELQCRRELLARIEELERELSWMAPSHGGMGHNNPPQNESLEEEDASALTNISETANILRVELSKGEPDAAQVAKSGLALRDLGKWLGGKGDVFADEFAKSLGKSLGETAGRIASVVVLLKAIAVLTGGWLQAITWPF